MDIKRNWINDLPFSVSCIILSQFLTVRDLSLFGQAISLEDDRRVLWDLVESIDFIFVTPVVIGKYEITSELSKSFHVMKHPLNFVNWLKRRKIKIKYIYAEGRLADDISPIIAVLDDCEFLDLKFLSLTASSWHGFPMTKVQPLNNIFKSLEYLSLSSCPYKLIQQIVKQETFSPSLLHLDLKNTTTTDKDVKIIYQKCKKLQRLFLDNTRVTDSGVAELIEKCEDLIELSIRECECHNICFGLEKITQGSTKMEKLHIDGCAFPPRMLISLACKLECLMISPIQGMYYALMTSWGIYGGRLTIDEFLDLVVIRGGDSFLTAVDNISGNIIQDNVIGDLVLGEIRVDDQAEFVYHLREYVVFRRLVVRKDLRMDLIEYIYYKHNYTNHPDSYISSHFKASSPDNPSLPHDIWNDIN